MAMPVAGKQAPGVYRLKVGTFEVTVLSDGNLAIDRPMFAGDAAGADRLLDAAFMPKGPIPTCVNQWLINTGGKLVLVDTGGGFSFAPTLGKMHGNLAIAGVDPRAVDAVVITHMHPDHIPGLVGADGKMAFPNAVVHVNVDEYAFWTSDEIRAKAPDEFKAFFDLARASIKPYADAGKVQMFKDGATFAPGITAAAMPGHTVGHSMVRVSSDGSDFLIWGDIVHCAALQFPEPDRGIGFDSDPALAIANRKKVFDMVATDRLLFAGAHLPFPGVGHAAKSGSGYAYVPLTHAEHY
jgi:glyoxylase-like metal-dependent hydrolase (beta-lactamase superfamily II)